jgi:3'-phosphoadenosine 5'-phosphosulfate (PAPS) 3'-phosphatase
MRALGRLDVATVRAIGSAGLKGVSVAEGSADAYLAVGAAGQRWDVCAVDALVTASGGRVTDLCGHDLDYRRKSLLNHRGLLVTNGRIHRAFVDRLASAGPES